MKKFKDWPDKDEYVICTITKINPNSVFAELDEYKKNGMIHVSEISSTWVRDIRNHVKLGQKTVAKVLYIDTSRGFVNLSLKRAKPTIKREKISEYKNEKKAENLLQIAAKGMKKTLDDAYKEVGLKLQEKFGLMYAGFEIAATKGKKELIKEGISEKWASKIEELAKKNIKPKEVSVKASLILTSFKSDGIEVIKKALQIDDKNVKITYVSAPKYSITVKGSDYPSCEKKLDEISQKIVDSVKKSGGEGQIQK